MRKEKLQAIRRIGFSLLLLGVGYLLGSNGTFQLATSVAQPPLNTDDDSNQAVDLANETVKQIQVANATLGQAMESLRLEGKYNPATTGMNPYLILTGGGDAIADLEAGIGVDPITFAELYAGMALHEVGDEITRDQQNRLLYKNKLIRMYSVERMKKRYETYQAIQEKRVLP
ncbi:hypothetical protein [Rubinisphaera sp.]|uniref:hypothetical protein n=1 Tax=Rubinisphaera sp. TaxID=2024857 RepID=UPI000C0CB5BC|nr:hypothetical protein [Rubinisphaera sp.]MBV11555.1 hypothetical protein [Rubinisphaera sp.]HCS53955.1 hypothetical protein [Planctomycetaceae bacterium]|tara:strand:- start:9047 stop:9565 length:519 start_codon:yes stop_codon:yes gene_type:complete